MASEVDSREAYGAGFSAVTASLLRAEFHGEFAGTIGIQRRKGRKYAVDFVWLPVSAAAKYTRSVPEEFIAENGCDVTKAFLDYARPIVGELPKCEIF
jgi:6-phosphofructokinase 1